MEATVNPDSNQLLKQIAQELYINNLELNKERKRIQEVLFQVAEIVFSIDQKFKIVVFNSSAEIAFNISKENAIGRHADEIINLISRKNSQPIKVKDYAFVNKDKVRQNLGDPIIVKREADEDSYYKLNFNNILINSDVKECVISLSDITDEIELDKEKDEFISIASHELKTPVTIIKTNLWMFEHTLSTELTESQKRLLGETDEGIKRLSKIVSNLLDISRVEQGRLVIEKKKVDINQLVDEVTTSYKELLKKKKLKLLFSKTRIKEVLTDRDKIIEILDNLISNGIKYTKRGHIKIAISSTRKEIKLSVSDTGPGIAKKDYPRLFQKFGRGNAGLKQQVLGASTGLGLYISKRIIEELGGKIGFTSELGKGSTFWFTIPKNSVSLTYSE